MQAFGGRIAYSAPDGVPTSSLARTKDRRVCRSPIAEASALSVLRRSVTYLTPVTELTAKIRGASAGWTRAVAILDR
jgi:hypothetical protein